MATTIQISDDLQKELAKRKISSRDTYEEIIWDVLEDTMELSDQAKKQIEQSRKQIKQGKFHTLNEAKKRLGL